MTSRYQAVFDLAKKQQRGILVPFVMLGDPNMEQCLRWIDLLIENGADALELGMPFSDPVADGPVIQASSLRALASGTTPTSCFEAIHRIRIKYPAIPMGLLTYANLAVSNGVDPFYQKARDAGLDSVLLADIPVHGCQLFSHTAKLYGIDHILIAPPNASEETLKKIADNSKGYTYVVSRSGVTGANNEAGYPVNIVRTLLKYNAPPSLLGFGISSAEDVARAIQTGCSGAICGSALVQIMALKNENEKQFFGRKLMMELCSGLKHQTNESRYYRANGL